MKNKYNVLFIVFMSISFVAIFSYFMYFLDNFLFYYFDMHDSPSFDYFSKRLFPNFIRVILPLAFLLVTLFVYNRKQMFQVIILGIYPLFLFDNYDLYSIFITDWQFSLIYLFGIILIFAFSFCVSMTLTNRNAFKKLFIYEAIIIVVLILYFAIFTNFFQNIGLYYQAVTNNNYQYLSYYNSIKRFVFIFASQLIYPFFTLLGLLFYDVYYYYNY